MQALKYKELPVNQVVVAGIQREVRATTEADRPTAAGVDGTTSGTLAVAGTAGSTTEAWTPMPMRSRSPWRKATW
jgi:hypothetical protein